MQIPKETERATKDSRPSISPEAPELGPLSLVGLPKMRLRPLQALKLDLALSLPQLTLGLVMICSAITNARTALSSVGARNVIID